jgi:hypothetical protein
MNADLFENVRHELRRGSLILAVVALSIYVLGSLLRGIQDFLRVPRK